MFNPPGTNTNVIYKTGQCLRNHTVVNADGNKCLVQSGEAKIGLLHLSNRYKNFKLRTKKKTTHLSQVVFQNYNTIYASVLSSAGASVAGASSTAGASSATTAGASSATAAGATSATATASSACACADADSAAAVIAFNLF